MKYTKALTTPDDYKFTMSDELLEIAERELNETDDRRNHALQMLRDWAEKNPRIVKVRMGKIEILKLIFTTVFHECSLFQMPSSY